MRRPARQQRSVCSRRRFSRRVARPRLGDGRRQGRRLYPRARQGRSRHVRHRARHRRWRDLRHRRFRPRLHHPVGVEALHVWLRAAALRPRLCAAPCRRRADRRSVQLDRARRGRQPPVQPHGQCRRHRRRRADAGQLARRAHRHHDQSVLRPCRPEARDRRGRVPLGARHRPSQPGHRLYDAEYRHDRRRSHRDARPLFPPMLHRRHLPRPRHDGGDARQ